MNRFKLKAMTSQSFINQGRCSNGEFRSIVCSRLGAHGLNPLLIKEGVRTDFQDSEA